MKCMWFTSTPFLPAIPEFGVEIVAEIGNSYKKRLGLAQRPLSGPAPKPISRAQSPSSNKERMGEG